MMNSVRVLIALCLLPQLTSAADDDAFPIISWFELGRTPFSSSSGSSSPTCIDFDSDGDFDCFVGTASGEIEYYENTGSSSAFIFTRDSSKDITDNVPTYSKPMIADFNGDGDYDFYIGGFDGTISLWLNNGDDTYTEEDSDVFGSAIKKYNSASGGGLVKGASRGVGAVAGSFALTGMASVGVGALGSMLMMLPGVTAASSSLGTYSAPTCADMDGDGDLDCIVGYYDGSCALFMNHGTSTEANFKLTVNDLFKGTYTDVRMASPFLRDFDSDGDLDVMVGLDGGEVYYYENTAGKNATSFSRDDFTLGSSDLFGSVSSIDANAAPWCGQTDGDSKVECFVGSMNGTAYVYDSELPDPTPAPAVSYPPTPAPSMVPFRAPTITASPTTGANPSGNNKNNSSSSVSMGSTTGFIIALVFSLLFVGAAGGAFYINKSKRQKAENDAFDQMAGQGGGGGTSGLELFSEPTKAGNRSVPVPVTPNQPMQQPSQGGVGPAYQQQQQQQQQQQFVAPPTPPSTIGVASVDVQVMPPVPKPGPPPLAVAVRSPEYDDGEVAEEAEVRVFGAVAVKGDSARFAVAQQAQSSHQGEAIDYKTVTDEKYLAKMQQQQAGVKQNGGMYTAPVPPPPAASEDTLSPMQQQQFEESRVSSIDAIVHETEGGTTTKEEEGTETF